ncbi:SDR family oxidoreductase [Patulibacter minatonensis]|uniref:SDR family oxidoreductase n=1 Tax=Patulibacter minatonensis TaxID=298163 RepID=UPI00056D2A2B|nr:SDR family oxidoreductase [Patulibacter minatonensis]
MAARTILFTGFPGFIGARLIPLLLEQDPDATVVALVEPRMVPKARSVAQELGLDDRLQIQSGDITAPRLGLDEATYRRLASETVAVHHLAAIYDLAVPLSIAERVNVEGTQNVVDFCRACDRLERHNYVSTAYVAGQRRGTVKEADLAAGQAFKNHYESTKFAAEVLVRASMDDVPTTIYRPGIVVGDSKTGVTQKFDGPYYLLRTIQAAIERHTPLIQPGAMTAPFNVVPVDFVIDAIVTGASHPEFSGETLHLVDPDPITAAELYRLLCVAYAGREAKLRLPWKLVDQSLRLSLVRHLLGGTPRESLIYLNHQVRYDTARATALLAGRGVRCPPTADYVGPMVAFFREHQDDPAFAPLK